MAKKKITADQAQKEVDKYANKVSAADVAMTVSNESKFKLLFEHHLAEYWEDVKVVFSMLKDITTNKYKQCPWRTIAALVGALAYVLAPLDLVPDFIPVWGWLDDGAVIATALKFAKNDLEEYKVWKASRTTKGSTKLLKN